MIIGDQAQLTPKESAQMDYEKEMFEKNAKYNLEIKKLELEVSKIEAKFSVLLKIPIIIIKLPVYCLFAIGFIIAIAKGKEPSQNFWDFMHK